MFLNAQTIASGLRVPKAFADYLMLQIIRDSKGTAIAVSDEEILQTMKDVAKLEGIFVCPEGAATIAALKYLLQQKVISESQTIIAFNTASGLKYLELFQ